MRDLLTHPTPRRGFLARLAAATTALGAVAAGRGAGAQPDAAAPAADEWDMSWVARLTAPHRQVFDVPEVLDGMALHQASAWMHGYREVHGAGDDAVNAVLVIRHFAVPLAMGDALWARYALGEAMAAFTADKRPIRDPARDEPARRNPYLNANARPGDPHVSMYLWPDGGLDTLLRRGAIVLVCNLALEYLARTVAAPRDGTGTAEALAVLRAGLLPGTYVMPSGIFAVGRAEEAGCRYIYSA